MATSDHSPLALCSLKKGHAMENTSARTPEEIYAKHGQALVAEDLDRRGAARQVPQFAWGLQT
jgi:hypothetical protein